MKKLILLLAFALSVCLGQAQDSTLVNTHSTTDASTNEAPLVGIRDLNTAPPKQSISNTISNDEFSFNVFPNPGDGSNINVAMEAIAGQEILVVIYDVTGKEKVSKTIIMSSDTTNFAMATPTNLSAGIYFITASSGKNSVSKKLIVK